MEPFSLLKHTVNIFVFVLLHQFFAFFVYFFWPTAHVLPFVDVPCSDVSASLSLTSLSLSQFFLSLRVLGSLLILCTVCLPVPSSLPLIMGFSPFSLIWEAAFSFIPIFSGETMLSLQILSFGGLLKCGLISEWREGRGRRRRGGDGAREQNHYPKVSQRFHGGVTISSGHDTITYTVDYIRLDYNFTFDHLYGHLGIQL